jgi:hypothetical protein
MNSLLAFFNSYSSLLAAIFVALTSPLFASFYKISPPSPPAPNNLEVFTSLLCLLVLLTCYAFGPTLHRRMRSAVLALSLCGLALAILLYFNWYNKVIIYYPSLPVLSTLDPPSGGKMPVDDNRMIIGTTCTEEAKLVFPKECITPALLVNSKVLDVFSSSGLPGSLWAEAGIRRNTNNLVFLWFAIFISLNLSIATIAASAKKQ